ncbi:MAG: YtrH family sporulation protein [Symbiobacterium sp.]|uniref:YtrH family sporulation protein n=1 Tax=Symbiobacterium sp. TaxID=1971213 RepID=UPI003464DD65
MDDAFAAKLLSNFLIALGVTLGGSLSGAAASLLAGGHPLDRLRYLSEDLRLWGILVALSGSFEPLRTLEQGLLYGQVRALFRQVVLMAVAMAGANVAYFLIQTVAGRRP